MKNLFPEIPCLKGERVTLKKITAADVSGLSELINKDIVYRYLPTFLFERRYADIDEVIAKLYTECLEESLILGVFAGDELTGLIELYGLREEIHKVSVGYRFLERFWGKGLASEALSVLIRYLYDETDIEIITASTMVENKASARVLRRNGFDLVVSAVGEDWGYEELTIADKWIR